MVVVKVDHKEGLVNFTLNDLPRYVKRGVDYKLKMRQLL